MDRKTAGKYVAAAQAAGMVPGGLPLSEASKTTARQRGHHQACSPLATHMTQARASRSGLGWGHGSGVWKAAATTAKG
jgi:hypothetical protein